MDVGGNGIALMFTIPVSSCVNIFYVASLLVFFRINTVNSEKLGFNRNNLNSHFEIFFMN